MFQNKNKKWYAIYTKSRAEKRVYDDLIEKEIKAYIPLQKKLKQWSDRKKMIETPLFTCYVFVFINIIKERLKVLQTDNVVKFVSFSGEIDPIPQKEIDMIKLIIDSNTQVEISGENFKPGDKVKVVAGSLKGLEGEIIKGKHNRVLFRITSVNQNLLVKIPAQLLEMVNK